MAVDVTGLIADPDMSPYVTAKHAVIGLTRAAAVDYAKSGVRVIVVDGGQSAHLAPLASLSHCSA